MTSRDLLSDEDFLRLRRFYSQVCDSLTCAGVDVTPVMRARLIEFLGRRWPIEGDFDADAVADEFLKIFLKKYGTQK